MLNAAKVFQTQDQYKIGLQLIFFLNLQKNPIKDSNKCTTKTKNLFSEDRTKLPVIKDK